MTLPPWMETQIWKEIETIEESKKMQYITSVERIGRAKGIKQGIAKGESRLLKRL